MVALLAAVATALAPFAAAQAPDTTPPTLVRGEIDGTTMTLYFNEALDGTSVPAARAFRTTVRFPCNGHCTLNCWAKGPVEISGNKVMVGGIRRASPGYRAWFYAYYTSIAVNKLRDVAGNEVRDIPPMMELTNISKPSVSLIAVSGTVVTLTFDTQLDTSSKPAASAFTVTVGNSPASLATTDPVEIDGARLKLNLASAVASGASVKVSYTKPASNPLQDPAGNQVKSYQVDGIAGRTVNPDCGKWASPFQAASFQAA
ncbi:MAG: SwmB domain-containing protein, partial [Spirochaetaceae bacterium]|nr:SwmB domain-containing protein [Spirochaetaceae bacterium]